MRDASGDEREAFVKEWDDKVMAVLTPAQRSTWQGLLTGSTTVAASTSPAEAEPASAAATDEPSPDAVASFDATIAAAAGHLGKWQTDRTLDSVEK